MTDVLSLKICQTVISYCPVGGNDCEVRKCVEFQFSHHFFNIKCHNPLKGIFMVHYLFIVLQIIFVFTQKDSVKDFVGRVSIRFGKSRVFWHHGMTSAARSRPEIENNSLAPKRLQRNSIVFGRDKSVFQFHFIPNWNSVFGINETLQCIA